MVESKILTKQELKLYDEFSTNFTPKTKRDYLLKIIYFMVLVMVIMIGLVMVEVIVGALQGMYTGIYGGKVLQTEPGQKMI